ncbi:hypothetical protein HO133_011102 [Letharia lupina]|uniref:Uncharacterized protein n=1 Tax=Letharia lupina TaxID=560253 RepID=A0A8H6FDN5_9LECA|nr:uncharacterized protein HO133_011102 [Letharia lupina]KAF6224525.1 hypothetical protein HO133_011102 [Letharia lupina]
MADQNTRGFRKFMLDPKSSVMTYIADNIPPEHISHQQGSNGRLQNGALNGQQPNVQDPNRLQQNQILSQNPQNQSQDAFMRPPLPNRPSQSNSQSSSPRPGYAQPVQSSQMPMNTPYIASNMSQADQGLSGYSGAQSQLPGSQSMSNLSLAQESMSQQGPQGQYSSNQNGSPSTAMMGQGPPQPGARRRNSPQSAPRLYHRMALDFEITKKAFFLAKSRKSLPSPHQLSFTDIFPERNTQETASAAYELESSSRRIWGLRHEHSWEFEGYSEAGHEAVFAHWRAEYEMWADTVLDIQDGQILADAANASKYGNASADRDAEGWDSQPGQARSGFQELNGGNRYLGPSSMPQEQTPTPQQQVFPQQQMPQLQTLSMDQPLPPAQSMQNNQPPQPMPPGAFPQTEPPAPLNDPSVPPQQSPQPPPMPMAQNPPPNMQPGPFTASPNMPYANETPNPPPQQPMPRPGQPPNQPQAPSNRPPQQQYPQQQAYGPRTSMSPAQTMPQGQAQAQGQNVGMGPRPTASPRPGPQMQMQMSPSLQAGGHMSGNGGGRS